MKDLKQELKKAISEKNDVVADRIKAFQKINSEDDIFKELCFCLMTANFNAERSIKIQNEIDDGFIDFNEKKLAKKLKELGHRFPNMRAKYIVGARKHKEVLKKIINQFNENELREWLIENIKGLGYKESSHFLRNIGFTDFAIIDFHIIDILTENGMIEKPKTITKKKYLEIENVLRKIGKELDLNMSELDMYLWYIETGKILK